MKILQASASSSLERGEEEEGEEGEGEEGEKQPQYREERNEMIKEDKMKRERKKEEREEKASSLPPHKVSLASTEDIKDQPLVGIRKMDVLSQEENKL